MIARSRVDSALGLDSVHGGPVSRIAHAPNSDARVNRFAIALHPHSIGLISMNSYRLNHISWPRSGIETTRNAVMTSGLFSWLPAYFLGVTVHFDALTIR